MRRLKQILDGVLVGALLVGQERWLHGRREVIEARSRVAPGDVARGTPGSEQAPVSGSTHRRDDDGPEGAT